MESLNLDAFVEEILDVCLEQRRDNAAIIVRDRIAKDVIRPLEKELLQAYQERDELRKLK